MSRAPRAGRPGPAALLLPLATLTLVSAWLILGLGGRNDPPFGDDVPGVVSDESVDGLAGSWDAGGGSRLDARLVPLHADAGREAFESEALAERLDLAPGQPWLLVLDWSAVTGAETGASTGTGAPTLPLGAVAVRDAEGVALGPAVPLPDDPPAGFASTLHDPLRVLLAPPSAPLRPGRSVEVVLWGRAPGPEASLWFHLRPGGMAVGPVRGIPLAAARLARAALPRHLARLDRPTPGNGREEGRAPAVR